MNTKPTELLDTRRLSPGEIQSRWEEAYTRFETPEEEVNKFVQRLHRLGQQDWPRECRIIDIFSGRCNGIKALEKLGFSNLEGVDISPDLLSHYQGTAKLHVADCRKLPFEDNSSDIIIVQGGLHHLHELPEDLKKTLSEVHRVLVPGGSFVMVEPWNTAFLRIVHFLSERELMRIISGRLDAFAAMTHYEAATYFNWLSRPAEILQLLNETFALEHQEERFGKLFYIGRKID